jgi:hypothetical protein
VLREPGEVARVVGGVRDRQVALGAEPVGEEVVEHAAGLVAQHAVLGAALRERVHVVGEQPLEQRRGARAARLDLAHVADVEHARATSHGRVLLADPGVLDRHLPARERDEPGTGGTVPRVQRRALEGVRLSGHRGVPTLAPGLDRSTLVRARSRTPRRPPRRPPPRPVRR